MNIIERRGVSWIRPCYGYTNFLGRENVMSGIMSDDQQAQAQQQRQATTREEVEQKINLTDLVEDLGPCAAQWDMLGIMLNLEGEKLDAIEGESNRVSKCLRKVLEEWFKTQCSPNTKEQLLKVLRTKAMGPQEVLAKEIEDNKDIPPNFSPKNLPILMTSLDSIAAKYQAFAIQLGVPHDTVKKLEHSVKNVQRYLADMLDLWLKQDRPISELVDAVRKPPIQNVVLAEKLEEKYGVNIN